MAPDQGKWELAPGELVRAEGLEPSRHGLKVRARPAIKDGPPTFTVPVPTVLPVLSTFPTTSAAGRLSAVVRPARSSRPGCRQSSHRKSVHRVAVMVRLTEPRGGLCPTSSVRVCWLLWRSGSEWEDSRDSFTSIQSSLQWPEFRTTRGSTAPVGWRTFRP